MKARNTMSDNPARRRLNSTHPANHTSRKPPPHDLQLVTNRCPSRQVRRQPPRTRALSAASRAKQPAAAAAMDSIRDYRDRLAALSSSGLDSGTKLLEAMPSLPALPASVTTAASAHGQTLLAEGQRRLGWLQRSIRTATATATAAATGRYVHPEPEPEGSGAPPPAPQSTEADIDYVLVYHDPSYTPTPRDRAPQSTHPLPLLAPPLPNHYRYHSLRAQISPYPTPWGLYPSSTNFQVTANGRPLEVVSLTSYDYVHFGAACGAGGVVEVKIASVTEDITSYRISPAKMEIRGSMADDIRLLSFTIAKPGYFIVKINLLRELLILCDPAEEDVPPPLGEGVFNVLEGRYSADQTGKRYSTEAFQRALDDANRFAISTPSPPPPPDSQPHADLHVEEEPRPPAPQLPRQAVVYVPPGLYLIQNLILPSHIALYLEAGSVLKFSGIHHDYIPHWHKTSQGRDITRWITTAPPSATSTEQYPTTNITIYGRGTIDGSGHYSTTTQNPRIGNNILAPISVNGFVVRGVIIRDSGSWAVTPVRCADVCIENVKILNRMDMPENDCLAVMESCNVRVSNSIAVSMDDANSVRTWTVGADAVRGWGAAAASPGMGLPARDIAWRGCLAWTKSWAFKVGQAVFSRIENVTVEGCVVYDAAFGMGIHHRFGSAPVASIYFLDCDVERVSHELPVAGGGRSWFAVCGEEVGSWGKGTITDVEVHGGVVFERGRGGAVVRGVEDGGEVGTVFFRNVMMAEDGDGCGRKAGSWRDVGVHVADRRGVKVFVEDEEVVLDKRKMLEGFESDESEDDDGEESDGELVTDW
ncbi:pectin lyase fold/virulence factor [Peziza echinospora]|nr:pectin lyase fold/virulence factor [Peziza echinospora]